MLPVIPSFIPYQQWITDERCASHRLHLRGSSVGNTKAIGEAKAKVVGKFKVSGT